MVQAQRHQVSPNIFSFRASFRAPYRALFRGLEVAFEVRTKGGNCNRPRNPSGCRRNRNEPAARWPLSSLQDLGGGDVAGGPGRVLTESRNQAPVPNGP